VDFGHFSESVGRCLFGIWQERSGYEISEDQTYFQKKVGENTGLLVCSRSSIANWGSGFHFSTLFLWESTQDTPGLGLEEC